MAEIIKRLLDPQKIERYLKGVADVEAPWSVAGLLPRDMWISRGPDGIALSATRCEHALIEYELWDGEPPASDWDESWSGSVHLTSGKVLALSGYQGDTTEYEEFDLGRRDHEWQVRVHRKLLSHENFTADIIGFALFKLQFWSPSEAVQPSPEGRPTTCP
ncbi:hypothetical protein [Microbispora siamensis]|uniref:Uncharacterized protein n=1 Tax=Microbispora siamensis TaxID=564413 RepID=A0ABQ4GN70_9ACTN|nr:hypothetical protein [Microbispora siamensis]GIH62869.1 hypothetical protein Msi02_36860 [Microbispora siamensis]